MGAGRILVALILSLGPFAVAAQESGRFTITPESKGFVRLDTRTGATTHCAWNGVTWACTPVIEEVGSLSATLSAIDARVDALAGQVAALAVPPAVAGPSSPGFLATAVTRLLAMVRVLKHGRADAAETTPDAT